MTCGPSVSRFNSKLRVGFARSASYAFAHAALCLLVVFTCLAHATDDGISSGRRNLKGNAPNSPAAGMKITVQGSEVIATQTTAFAMPDIANAIALDLPSAPVSKVMDNLAAPTGTPGMVPGGSAINAPPNAIPFNATPPGPTPMAISGDTDGSLWPFTTRAAHSSSSSSPTNLHPWSATGKLTFKKPGDTLSWFCSASLIGPGLVVTAAHCVCKFGASTFYNSWVYTPSVFDTTNPFGTWSSSKVTAPGSYYYGTDVYSTTAAPGVVTENDLAVLSLSPNSAGVYPGPSTGYYGYGYSGYAFTSQFVGGAAAAHITELGYPLAFSNGKRMIRTDGIALTKTPNIMEMGSAQTGGSSGGPWLVNFGGGVSSTVSLGTATNPNVVMGVTSYGSEGLQKQGASRFGLNKAYPTTPNIVALVDVICNSYAGGGATTARCKICGTGC